VRIREIDALVDRIHGRTASSCQLRGDCLGDYFIVEPDGEVAHCDLYLGDPAYRLGNVVEDSFEQMRAGAPMRALQKARAAELAAMAGCAEFGTCQGWCPHETYLSQRHDPDHRDDCCGLAELISYVRAAGEAPARQPMPLPVPQVRAGA
jgi:uncharacterized protein